MDDSKPFAWKHIRCAMEVNAIEAYGVYIPLIECAGVLSISVPDPKTQEPWGVILNQYFWYGMCACAKWSQNRCVCVRVRVSRNLERLHEG